MTDIGSKTRRVWKSAQLLVGFHRDSEGEPRDTPFVWSPKNGYASIHRDPDERETFVELTGAEGDPDQDIQIKLRPDMIVLRRDLKEAWQGIKIDGFSVSVRVGATHIRVGYDGSIIREDGEGTTWIEADGGVLKATEFVDASMSGDGMELTRRTPDGLSVITVQGVLSKQR